MKRESLIERMIRESHRRAGQTVAALNRAIWEQPCRLCGHVHPMRNEPIICSAHAVLIQASQEPATQSEGEG